MIVAFIQLWPAILVAALVAALLVGLFLFYIWWKYVPEVARMFLQPPMFQPTITEPDPGGEDVWFPTEDGLRLRGTYYPAQADTRLGIVVFCHEFLSDRHSVYEYAGYLREAGFDLFAFDFRNHGDSAVEPGLKPIHWVSDRELIDVRGALAYLRSRPDTDPAGLALFGVSRGGGAALFVAADDPAIWAVATDGAFPTRSTMLTYVHRWAEMVVRSWWIHWMPNWIFRFVGATGRIKASRILGRTLPRLERAVKKIPPRPWLAIHGERDSYVPVSVVADLTRRAGRGASVELWVVPKAKHNRCREIAPEDYRRRVSRFLLTHAPRSPAPPSGTGDGHLPAEVDFHPNHVLPSPASH